ncbi:MAG TPA: CHAD domain-containing protein [Candidatus Melainabacteria bacterium]|nr:CHAD domain-containing protein [Candidatus Melainabacteria bacterium]
MVLIPLENRLSRLQGIREAPETAPPHLREQPWLELEQKTALGIYEDVEKVLKKLAKVKLHKEPAAKTVHETRVVLRRWESIWGVLERDGWNDKKFWKKTGSKLRKLHKMLGNLRDWDVNLEFAEQYELPDSVRKVFKKERAKAGKKVAKSLEKLEVKQLSKSLLKFLLKQPQQIAVRHAGSSKLFQSAYSHLEPLLAEQEDTARALEAHAHTPSELHELRLVVKSWRYLLADFFGLTNLELVKAQQLLGKLNDLERLSQLVGAIAAQDAGATRAMIKLQEQKLKLLSDFDVLRHNLPYGLRPSVTSLTSFSLDVVDD